MGLELFRPWCGPLLRTECLTSESKLLLLQFDMHYLIHVLVMDLLNVRQATYMMLLCAPIPFSSPTLGLFLLVISQSPRKKKKKISDFRRI